MKQLNDTKKLFFGDKYHSSDDEDLNNEIKDIKENNIKNESINNKNNCKNVFNIYEESQNK